MPGTSSSALWPGTNRLAGMATSVPTKGSWYSLLNMLMLPDDLGPRMSRLLGMSDRIPAKSPPEASFKYM